MKRLTIMLTFCILFLGAVSAQQPVSGDSTDPGIAPGNPFYGVERFVESLEVRIAGALGGPELKSKALANNAQERLAEARKLSEINRSDEATRAVQEYSRIMNQSRELAAKGPNRELGGQIDNISNSNVKVLNEVKDRVPDQAKRTIESAINASSKPESRKIPSPGPVRDRGGRPQSPSNPDNKTENKSLQEIGPGRNDTDKGPEKKQGRLRQNLSEQSEDNISVEGNSSDEINLSDSDNSGEERDQDGDFLDSGSEKGSAPGLDQQNDGELKSSEDSAPELP